MLREEVTILIYMMSSRKQDITIFIYKTKVLTIREFDFAQGGSVVENLFGLGIVKSREHARPITTRGDVVVVRWDVAPKLENLVLKLHS